MAVCGVQSHFIIMTVLRSICLHLYTRISITQEATCALTKPNKACKGTKKETGPLAENTALSSQEEKISNALLYVYSCYCLSHPNILSG